MNEFTEIKGNSPPTVLDPLTLNIPVARRFASSAGLFLWDQFPGVGLLGQEVRALLWILIIAAILLSRNDCPHLLVLDTSY